MKIVFATNNTHKIKEIQPLLPSSIKLLSLNDINCNETLKEDQNTLEGNSHQKANFIYDKYKISCFADDTGLEIDMLNGAPGVFSARFSGLPESISSDIRSKANIEKVLLLMKGATNRKARFRTVITLIINGKVSLFEGEVNGHILDVCKGFDGFGYDPIFIPEGFSKTFAEMTLEEKSEISHRARAVKKLIDYLTFHKIQD